MIFLGWGSRHGIKKKMISINPIRVIGARGGPCLKDGAREWTSRSRTMNGQSPGVGQAWTEKMKCPRPPLGGLVVLGVRGWE